MELIGTIRKTIDSGKEYVLLFNYILSKSGGKNTKKFSIVFLNEYSGLSTKNMIDFFNKNNFQFLVNKTNKLTITLDDKFVYSKYKKVEPKPSKNPEVEKMIDNVLLMLNNVTQKNFRLKTESHRSKIRSRIKEGMTMEDFAYVIKLKAMEWLDTSDNLFLRPETLFGTKMDGYRNQKIIQNNKSKLASINEAIQGATEFDWESNTDT